VGKTQHEIYKDVMEHRETSIRNVEEFGNVPWMPWQRYGESQLDIISNHLCAEMEAKVSVSKLEGGVLLSAFHVNCVVNRAIQRVLKFPFTVGVLEDTLDELELECIGVEA